MAQAQLRDARTALARISTGKEVNEESWMALWCNANWGALLQPIPLTLALLGSISAIASSTQDFPFDDAPYNRQHVADAHSFKTSLMQLVNNSLSAFNVTGRDMSVITDRSSSLPTMINQAVQLIIQGDPREVEHMLPRQLDKMLSSVDPCIHAARDAEETLGKTCGLALELMLACIHKVGSAEEKQQATQQLQSILSQHDERERNFAEQVKRTSDLLRESLGKAESDFTDAATSIPKTWAVVAMQAVENILQYTLAAANAPVSLAALTAQTAQATLSAVRDFGSSQSRGDTNGTQSSKTLPNAEALTDPGVVEAFKIRGHVDALNQLVRGGDSEMASGATYIEAALTRSAKNFDESKPVSKQLLDIVKRALEIGKAASNGEAAKQHRGDVDALIKESSTVVVQCNLVLQQPAVQAMGPGMPRPPEGCSDSAATLGVEASKRAVIETRAGIETIRDSYDRVATGLIDGQAQLGQKIAALANPTGPSLDALLPMLRQLAAALTTLRAHFSQLHQLFASTASHLRLLASSLRGWAQTLQSSTQLGGVSLGDFTRQLLYAQLTAPLKVAVVAQKSADAYLRVSERCISPAQRIIASAMDFPGDGYGGRERQEAQLARAQAEVGRFAGDASRQVGEMLRDDQRKFRENVERRLGRVVDDTARVFPAVRAPLPRELEEVKTGHVAGVDSWVKAAQGASPMYGAP